MEITGRILKIFPEKQVNDNFRIREFVVEYAENPSYPQTLVFQLTQDNCESIDRFSEGDTVSVTFNLRGRPWQPKDGGETKYFNSLEAWRIVQETSQETPQHGSESLIVEDGDDLPF